MIRKFKCEYCGFKFQKEDTPDAIMCTGCGKIIKKHDVNNKPSIWDGKSRYFYKGKWHED